MCVGMYEVLLDSAMGPSIMTMFDETDQVPKAPQVTKGFGGYWGWSFMSPVASEDLIGVPFVKADVGGLAMRFCR